MDFYKKFYHRTIGIEDIPQVLQSWLKSDSPKNTPSLEFILDEPPPLSPFEKVTVIGVDVPQELLKLHFLIVRGKWNEDEWEEVAPISQLPQIVGEFLGVVDPKDKCIYVQTDPFLPCQFAPIDPTKYETAHDEHNSDEYPETAGSYDRGPAIEIPVDEE